MRALKIAATGMAAQQMRVETISNNLSNMSTTGYNARRAEFADLHYQQLARAGAINAADGTVLPTGVPLGWVGGLPRCLCNWRMGGCLQPVVISMLQLTGKDT